MSRRSVGIVGLGAHLPDTIRPNAWWPPPSSDGASFIRPDAGGTTGAIVERLANDRFRGAVERRCIADDQRPSDMEIAACRAALASAGVDPTQIDLLIGASQVPDEVSPSNHGRVALGLGIPHRATAFTIDAGCASFIPQLNTACRLVEVGDHELGLIYQSSASSRVLDPQADWSFGLGDGAVAEVIGPVEPGLGLVGRMQWTRGELSNGLVIGRTDGDRRWFEAGSQPTGFQILARDPEVVMQMGRMGAEYAREICAALLSTCGYGPSDVSFFACAQATVWFGEACAAAIGIPEGRYLRPDEHFQRFGHLLPASASLNVYLAWLAGRLTPGDLVLIYSPGVGFTQGASLIRWSLPRPAQPSSGTSPAH
ncbi:MAG: 3-oxoacyl-[acyl-carrier-protein] synthase III C-terminal domain-containing protein [Myxococcota bacterium]